MVKCDGCEDLVKRSRAKSVTIDEKQRFFCCNGCVQLFWQKYETLMEAKQWTVTSV